MENSKTGQVRRGFARLLKEASCLSSLSGFKYADLESWHPFNLKIPKSLSLKYIGYMGDYDCYAALIRLVSREFMYILERHSKEEVKFLRITTAHSSHDYLDQQVIYYEVGIRNSLFMVGGCGYQDKPNFYTPLEDVFSCLSHIYELPVHRNRISLHDYLQYEDRLSKALDLEWQANSKYFERWVAKQKTYHQFKVGDKLTWNPDVREKPCWFRDKSWRSANLVVRGVKNIPMTCNCGLGDNAPIYLHPLELCNLARIHEAAHTQLLDLGNFMNNVSGYYFDTHKLFNPI